MEPILSVSHLEKVYGSRGNRTTALSDLSFDVLPGEFVGIMGASGSGKTTLLNCVSTIDAPTSGSITVDGTDVTALRGRRPVPLPAGKAGLHLPGLQPAGHAHGL